MNSKQIFHYVLSFYGIFQNGDRITELQSFHDGRNFNIVSSVLFY
jgi:hypothetical protein